MTTTIRLASLLVLLVMQFSGAAPVATRQLQRTATVSKDETQLDVSGVAKPDLPMEVAKLEAAAALAAAAISTPSLSAVAKEEEKTWLSAERCYGAARDAGLSETGLGLMKTALSTKKPEPDGTRPSPPDATRPPDGTKDPADRPSRPPSRPCCEAMTAQCLACKAGVSIADYCRENPRAMGCKDSTKPDDACSALPCGAACPLPCPDGEFCPMVNRLGFCQPNGSCSCRTSQPDGSCPMASRPVCSDDPTDRPIRPADADKEPSDATRPPDGTKDPAGRPSRPPSRPCCEAMTAQCLSCKAGVSIADYCRENPRVMGCKGRPDGCCKAFTAECLACQGGVSEADFCRTALTTPGCPKDTRPDTRPDGTRPGGTRPGGTEPPARSEYALPAAGMAILNGGEDEPRQLYCLTPAEASITSLPETTADGRAVRYGGRRPIAPQCCGKRDGKCYREVRGTCIAGRSIPSPTAGRPHISPFTYSDAAAYCDRRGLELCKKSCKNAGCNYNFHPVYSSLPCEKK